MKVIINAHGYVGQAGGAGGAGVFLQYLMRELALRHPVDVLVPSGSKLFDSRGSSARFIELPYIGADVLRHLREGPTVVLDPFGAVPCLPFPDDLGLVGVIHDLMHLDMPFFFGASERRDRSASFAAGVQRHDAVVVFSGDQARSVRRHYPGTNPKVIHHLPYTCLRPAMAQQAPEELVASAIGAGPFLLMPAVRWPHKNHRTVIEAFRQYVLLQRGSDLRLVLCGGPCAESRFSFFPQLDSADQRILDLGRVDDALLAALLKQASALVFPTLYEGFGIPVLEAAYLGKMVVASELEVFDEILGRETYRGVAEPLCHLRWIEAFASVESGDQKIYESRSAKVAARVQPDRFVTEFEKVLQEAAARYSHPSLYPQRGFRSGDRLGTTLITGLEFSDLHGSMEAIAGARLPSLGTGKPSRQSTIFRNPGIAPDRQQNLRTSYAVAPAPAGQQLEFFAWVRLLGSPRLTALNWSVNDGAVVNLLPTLADGEWRIVRQPIPASGYIDFHGVDGDRSEIPGVELEIHDAAVMLAAPVPVPGAPRQPAGLTLVVSALQLETDLAGLLASLWRLAEALGRHADRLRAVVLVDRSAVDAGVDAVGLPGLVRIHVVDAASFDRKAAVSIFSPYEPLTLMLLLEAQDLDACATPANLDVLGDVLGGRAVSTTSLEFRRGTPALWRPEERGVVLDAGRRIGEPIPVLDPLVVDKLAVVPTARTKPRFACIETDLTSALSHHATVTGLFLDGAAAVGFEPVMGLHKSASATGQGKTTSWSGFSAQVYQPGSAEAFATELAAFIDDCRLGRDDVIFMHSLSPQILLGAARFVAGRGSAAPRLAFRFFSTAEAMRGHALSYVKILRSILATRSVRERMTFFVESVNLQAYYLDEVGERFEILFNPQHPTLATVRDSDWFDSNLGGRAPTLAYFGEAREEKGFDFLPRILGELLAAPSMEAFRFIIQTGSNANNQTPRMARAKTELDLLRKRYPTRLRTFQSAETPEQFYFIMKHAQGLIAPYRAEAYGKRGTGVTLEALQMGMTVFATVDTDLYATFANTGRMIGTPDVPGLARAIIEHYASGTAPATNAAYARLLEGPAEVVRRLLKGLRAEPAPAAGADPVLWVGNDTFGEGCSAVYHAQKTALATLGRDCFELFVPWPDPNQAGVDLARMDEVMYGFASRYDSLGLAWIATPKFGPALHALLATIDREGPNHDRLTKLNEHFSVPGSLRAALANAPVERTILNYAHLHPVIRDHVPMDQIILETHDLQSYQHALRSSRPVSQIERIDELQHLSHFPRVIAISRQEYSEIRSACGRSEVVWRLPPLLPEPASLPLRPSVMTDTAGLHVVDNLPDEVVGPTPAMLSVYYARPDLLSIFDLSTRAGRIMFFRWWVLFGQYESPSPDSLTEEQAAWLADDEDPAADRHGRVPGLLMLVLSLRQDLRRVFIKAGKLQANRLRIWGAEHMRRELGTDLAMLQAARAPRPRLRDAAGVSRVMTAIAAADPIEWRDTPQRALEVLGRLANLSSIDMLLVGSGHPSNIRSFEWFIDDVYLKHLAPMGHNLFIVGSACAQLQKYNYPSLHLLGRCERIRPMIEVARSCPVPVIMGSGSAIKTIPALGWNGVVTITDHIDASFGLSDHGFPVCGNAREFADDLAALLADPAAREARRKLSQAYVEENLSPAAYAAFLGGLLGSNISPYGE